MKLFNKYSLLIPAVLLVITLSLMPVCAEETTTVPTIDTTTPTETQETTLESTETTETTVQDNNKSYVITERNGSGVILEEPTSLMFWEYPQLPAGQLREGTLKITNQGDKAVALKLSSIELPYGDDEALRYLAALQLTVTKSGEKIYEGPYSAVADKNGINIELPVMKPNESIEYHVSMRCAFDFMGEPEQVTSRVTWNFKASATVVVVPEPVENVGETVVRLLKIAAIVLVSIGLLLVVVQFIRRCLKKRTYKH